MIKIKTINFRKNSDTNIPTGYQWFNRLVSIDGAPTNHWIAKFWRYYIYVYLD